MVAGVLTLRSVIQNSRLARIACAALLVLFVLMCGVHLVGAYHDSEAGGLGLTDGLRQLILLLGAAFFGGALFRSPGCVSSPCSETPSRVYHVSQWRALVPIPLEAPLRR